MPTRGSSRAASYAFACVTTGSAAVITVALWPWVQPSPSLLFFPTIMVTALYAGYGAGMVATVLSTLIVAYGFIPPYFSLDLGVDDGIRVAVFAAMALLTTSLSAARARAEQEQQRTIGQLRDALTQLQKLKGPISVCPICHGVCGNSARWKDLRTFLQEDVGFQVEHTLCGHCAATHYKEFHPPVVAPSANTRSRARRS